MPHPMADRKGVQGTDCGQPYSARLVGDEVILSTPTGKCISGNGTCVAVEELTDTSEEMME